MRSVGKGGPEIAIKARRRFRRAHAVWPHRVGTAGRASCQEGQASAAFAHPTRL